MLAKRLGVKTGAIKAILPKSEWHHTSKHFNATDYYSEEEALELIDELKAWKAPSKDITIHENCSGSYLEWSGTRNHPHAKAIAFGPVRVTQKGDWFTLELAGGPIRKNKSTRGFILYAADGKRLTFNS